MKKIFITRRIKKDSFFYKKIKEAGHELYGISLLSFRQISFDTFPKVDGIFFYSQKGVQYFFKNINKKKVSLPKEIWWAGFGQATAKAIENQGVKCSFVGTGKAETTSTKFLKFAQQQKVLFPRAKNSKRSVQKILDGKLEMQDLIVYDNFPKKNIVLPEFDVLIFTSPMNVEAYFQNLPTNEVGNKIKKGQQFFAIGQTTAHALKEFGVQKVGVPSNPLMEEMVKMIARTF